MAKSEEFPNDLVEKCFRKSLHKFDELYRMLALYESEERKENDTEKSCHLGYDKDEQENDCSSKE
jgi:hypothetical protein